MLKLMKLGRARRKRGNSRRNQLLLLMLPQIMKSKPDKNKQLWKIRFKDESNAADDESGSEADDESDPAPPKKQKLRIPLKKKPGEKPVAKGISIQDPKDKPS